jgi:hypothetical protein
MVKKAVGGAPSGPNPLQRTGDSGDELVLPSGRRFDDWLDRHVRGGRVAKDRSGPAISSVCYEALDALKDELMREHGYSSREVSYGNLVEISVDLFYEHVFEVGPSDRRRRTGSRPRKKGDA